MCLSNAVLSQVARGNRASREFRAGTSPLSATDLCLSNHPRGSPCPSSERRCGRGGGAGAAGGAVVSDCHGADFPCGAGGAATTAWAGCTGSGAVPWRGCIRLQQLGAGACGSALGWSRCRPPTCATAPRSWSSPLSSCSCIDCSLLVAAFKSPALLAISAPPEFEDGCPWGYGATKEKDQ